MKFERELDRQVRVLLEIRQPPDLAIDGTSFSFRKKQSFGNPDAAVVRYRLRNNQLGECLPA